MLSFSITGIMVLLYLLGSPFLDRMELKSLDVRFLTRGEEPAGPFTVLATIDEESLDEIGLQSLSLLTRACTTTAPRTGNWLKSNSIRCWPAFQKTWWHGFIYD